MTPLNKMGSLFVLILTLSAVPSLIAIKNNKNTPKTQSFTPRRIGPLDIAEEDLSPLIRAVIDKDEARVKKLLKEGAQVSWQRTSSDGSEGPTALMVAAALGLEDICQFLLNAGASAHECLMKGHMWTAPLSVLRCAVDAGSRSLIVLLILKGANINQTTPTSSGPSRNLTLLGYAIQDELPLKTIELLINMGADVNKANRSVGKIVTDWTPLMVAVLKNNAPVVKLLMKAGANPLARNYIDGNKTALNYAKGACHEILLPLLKTPMPNSKPPLPSWATFLIP